MNVTITGITELNSALKKVTPQAETAVKHELGLIAADLQNKAGKLAPVDTGDLRGSAYTEVSGMVATIGFVEEYAVRQHEDMENRHPKGGQAKYLETPYKENVGKYTDALKNAIKKAVE